MTTDAVIQALAAGAGPALAVIIAAIIAQRAANQAIRAAELAQKATARAALDAIEAQHAASTAAAQAAEAARQLILTAQTTNTKLDGIASVGTATHKIVNNQRTVMLNVVAALAERIAKENPGDEAAQMAARAAIRDANGSPPPP